MNYTEAELNRKRSAAAAGCRCIRVVDDKLRAFEPLDIIYLGTHQVLVTHRIDKRCNTLSLNDPVILRRVLIEGKPVLKP